MCQRENGDFLATKIIGIGIQQISETLKLEIVVLQIDSTYFAFKYRLRKPIYLFCLIVRIAGLYFELELKVDSG